MQLAYNDPCERSLHPHLARNEGLMGHALPQTHRSGLRCRVPQVPQRARYISSLDSICIASEGCLTRLPTVGIGKAVEDNDEHAQRLLVRIAAFRGFLLSNRNNWYSLGQCCVT